MRQFDSHHGDTFEKKVKPNIPTTKEIMSGFVNDNTPGFSYWFTKILGYSIISSVVMYFIYTQIQ